MIFSTNKILRGIGKKAHFNLLSNPTLPPLCLTRCTNSSTLTSFSLCVQHTVARFITYKFFCTQTPSSFMFTLLGSITFKLVLLNKTKNTGSNGEYLRRYQKHLCSLQHSHSPVYHESGSVCVYTGRVLQADLTHELPGGKPAEKKNK